MARRAQTILASRPARGTSSFAELAQINVFDRVNFTGNSVGNRYNAQNVVFDTPSGTNASQVVSATPNAAFGRLTGVRDPRQVQLGLRLSF